MGRPIGPAHTGFDFCKLQARPVVLALPYEIWPDLDAGILTGRVCHASAGYRIHWEGE